MVISITMVINSSGGHKMGMKEIAKLIGTKAVVNVEKSLKIEVEIMDARAQFGRVDYLVRPLAGAGEQWLSSDRVCTNY